MEENRGAASSSLDGQITVNRTVDEIRPDRLQVDSGQSTTAIMSVKPLGALLWSLFSGIAYGIVAFSFMALIVFIIDSKGILASVNSLLGEAMQLSTSKLYTLSLLLAIVIAVFTSLLKWLNYMLYNASARLLGPVRTIIEIEQHTRKSKANRGTRRTPRSVHSAVNGEVKK